MVKINMDLMRWRLVSETCRNVNRGPAHCLALSGSNGRRPIRLLVVLHSRNADNLSLISNRRGIECHQSAQIRDCPGNEMQQTLFGFLGHLTISNDDGNVSISRRTGVSAGKVICLIRQCLKGTSVGPGTIKSRSLISISFILFILFIYFRL